MKEILDHGYVEFIESWGSDERIVASARMSTGKGFVGWGLHCAKCGHTFDSKTGACDSSHCDGRESKSGDEKLLRFLYENQHSTPFEMAGMTIEVKAPIFVFREWHRHRTQSYNEMSARYVPLPDENYLPTVDRLMMSGGKNKQAQGASDEELTEASARAFLEDLARNYVEDERVYQGALRRGVPKELARLVLPVSRYSRMRASANLRNWLAFLTLREAQNAQWEIRQYAQAVSALIREHFPRTHALYARTTP